MLTINTGSELPYPRTSAQTSHACYLVTLILGYQSLCFPAMNLADSTLLLAAFLP